MTREEAIIHLELPNDFDQDDVTEAYESLIFNQKKLILNFPPIGKLLVKRLNLVLKLYESFCILKKIPFQYIQNFDESFHFVEGNEFTQPINLIFRNYQEKLAEAKLQLQQAVLFDEVLQSCKNMWQAELLYLNLNLQIFNALIDKKLIDPTRQKPPVLVAKLDEMVYLQSLQETGIYYATPIYVASHFLLVKRNYVIQLTQELQRVKNQVTEG